MRTRTPNPTNWRTPEGRKPLQKLRDSQEEEPATKKRREGEAESDDDKLRLPRVGTTGQRQPLLDYDARKSPDQSATSAQCQTTERTERI